MSKDSFCLLCKHCWVKKTTNYLDSKLCHSIYPIYMPLERIFSSNFKNAFQPIQPICTKAAKNIILHSLDMPFAFIYYYFEQTNQKMMFLIANNVKQSLLFVFVRCSLENCKKKCTKWKGFIDRFAFFYMASLIWCACDDAKKLFIN